MMIQQPYIVLISGPNGTGKTTFYKNFINRNPVFKEAVFINFHYQNPGTSVMPQKAGAQTLIAINQALNHNQNFIYETTGTGHFLGQFINRAKNEYGYKIYSFHLCLFCPELNIARVRQRVQSGGHDIPTDVILRRYQSSLSNMPNILSSVNCGVVIDNSYDLSYTPIFMVRDGYIINFKECPAYLNDIHDAITQMFPEISKPNKILNNSLNSIIDNLYQNQK